MGSIVEPTAARGPAARSHRGRARCVGADGHTYGRATAGSHCGGPARARELPLVLRDRQVGGGGGRGGRERAGAGGAGLPQAQALAAAAVGGLHARRGSWGGVGARARRADRRGRAGQPGAAVAAHPPLPAAVRAVRAAGAAGGRRGPPLRALRGGPEEWLLDAARHGDRPDGRTAARSVAKRHQARGARSRLFRGARASCARCLGVRHSGGPSAPLLQQLARPSLLPRLAAQRDETLRRLGPRDPRARAAAVRALPRVGRARAAGRGARAPVDGKAGLLGGG
ncbi:hypothetical protein T492DRAFT_1100842 [Pavlovales sp. CCMP2436]|nr:hypothetical protein T492DRAFT_1100842 [Pavlovales sp. CCMP2436]